jgi:hypothetical protein
MVTRLLFEDEIEQMNPTSLLDVQAASRPTAVLFGDSMSEYVGYKADGTPDDKYGGSVADVIANNLGIQVQNLATGGETSNEALAGGAKFGAFQSYIEQNKPQYAIIRYGAADAIKNQDPAVTLQSVQQMVDIAKANGVTPIIVGVSELYGAQNSKTGNIAGYIDPGAEQRANQINAGLKQLAEANGLSFTDVREATSAGQGDLLDGVHTNADFGKKMADAISEDIAAKNVIAEARVPQLPPNVDSLSNEEKGRLYNDFISQGFTDAQIRTAARAESDQDWNALKRIAADVRNTTPAAIEQQATMQTPQGAAAQPEGLLSGQAAQSQANRLDLQSLVTPEDAANIRSAYEIGAAYPIVRGNEVYSFNPDGSIEYTRMNPGGIGATIGLYSSTGEEIVPQYYNADFGKTSTATRLLQAGLAAGIGGILGPAGAGLLSAPVAAATGAGLTSYGVTGDLESALKSAALGGLTAYGFQEFVNPMLQQGAYDQAFAAADAANMANAGLDANTIAANLQTYVDPATATSLANSAATQAGSLSYANQLVAQGFTPTEIATALTDLGVSNTVAQSAASAAADGITQIAAQDLVSNITYQPQVRNPIQASPGAIEVTGTAVQPGLLTAPVAAATSGLLNVPVQQVPVQTTTPSLLDTQTVSVQGATTPAQVQATAPAAAIGAGLTPSQTVQVQTTTAPAQSDVTAPAAVVGAITPSQAVQAQAPAQQVQVQTTTAAQDITADTASAVLSSLVGQPVSVAGAAQQVQVTGQAPVQQVAPEVAAALISAATGQQVTVAGQTISQPADSSLGAAAGSLLQTVPVQSTTLPDQAQISAPAGAAAGSLVSQLVPVQATTLPAQTDTAAPTGAAVGGLLSQTVPVQSTTIPAQADMAAPTGAAVGGLLETVPVQSTTIPPQSQATAPVSAAVGTLAPTQAVTIEDRPIRREEAQILTPVVTGTVAGVPVADVTVPRSSTGQIQGSTTVNPLVAAGLLGLGATTLAGGQGQTSQFDQAAFDAIINASRPTYPRGQFTPMFGPGGTGMYQIAPTDVYNYFGPPYGAGRFGALTQPFTLPGLLGPNMGLMATPTRGSSI